MDTWTFRYVRRGDPAYEDARIAACWNGRVPDRFPEIIAFPECKKHVQAIVRFAKAQDLTIGTKSGGHSWTASFLRDGGILVDLARMNKFSIDTAAQIAQVEPAAYGSDLNDALLPQNLMFPGGHCPTVGMGGFLLQGGFGWNSRKWGVACESILAIDVVDADGNLLHATAAKNSEFFWAARGAGCGYFAIVTQFYLRVYPLPHGMMTARYVFGIEEFDEVVTAIDDGSSRFPSELEVSLFVGKDQDGVFGKPSLAIVADVLAESEKEARRAIGIVHSLLPLQKALSSTLPVLCTLKEMLARFDELLDNRGLRYECDNAWTDSPVRLLLPALHATIDNLGPGPTHLYILWWLPIRDRPDMAFSMEGRLYIAVYGIDSDPLTDTLRSDFVVNSIRGLGDHSRGTQLADENLPAAPKKFMTTRNYLRLEAFRAKHDPEGRFYGYMRVPKEFQVAQLSSL